LSGNGGSDLFVLGDNGRGRYYDNGSKLSSGTSDYALIKDFGADDKLQLDGLASNYLQRAITLNGVDGMGIYHDTNGNGAFDSRDELIALLQGVSTTVALSQFVFV
jgi:hypothetical protein